MHAVRRDLREIVLEQIEFRELLFQMTSRDLLVRYKQTAMGFAWAVLMPLLNTAIFSIVFMRVVPVHTRVPYPLFAFCGLLVWNFTGSALRFAVTSLTANTTLVTKVYFPREIFPLSAVAVSLVDYAVAAIVLVAMMAYYGVAPSSAMLLLPTIVAVHVAFTAALALLLSMANLFYRDVKYLFDVGLTVWMFASAVVYPVDEVTGWVGTFIRANPMTAIVDAYRNVLLYGRFRRACRSGRPRRWCSSCCRSPGSFFTGASSCLLRTSDHANCKGHVRSGVQSLQAGRAP